MRLLFSAKKPAISLKRGKIGPRLLLMTNRKLPTRFRLVRKSMALDDLERPFRTLFQNTCNMRSRSQSRKHEWIDPYYQRQRCSEMNDCSFWQGLCGYSRGFLGDEASNDSGVNNRKRRFAGLSDAIYAFGTLGYEAINIIILFSPLWPFHWPHNM